MSHNPWNEIDLQFLIETYPDHLSENIAKALNCPVHRIYNKANQLGLKKSESFMQSQISGRLTKLVPKGIQYRFPKGHKPFNKGKKWNEFMSEEGQRNSRKTTFKKDNIPATCRFFGKPYLLIREKDGHTEKTWYIQVNKQRKTYLTYLCQQNGIDLKNSIPRLKNGVDINKVPTLDDIEIISYRENMIRNSSQRFPEEVRKLIQIKGVLNRQINKHYELRNNID